MPNPIDLTKLRTDIETATPHQIPPWQDTLTADQIRQLITRAEQLAANSRHMRAVMRKP